MKITFLGHGGFHFEFGGKNLILDPFVTPNEAAAKVIDIKKLKADYILVTHAHGDHIADVQAIAGNTGATVIAPYEIANYFAAKGLKIHPMGIGGKMKFDFGTLKMVTAVHSSGFDEGGYGANPVGMVLWNDDECFYLAGDTGLTMDMKLIPMTCPELDFAVFPIGDNFTMGYEDAVIASDFVECNKIIGCHYNTFDIIAIDTDEANKAFTQVGKDLILPEIGKTFEI